MSKRIASRTKHLAAAATLAILALTGCALQQNLQPVTAPGTVAIAAFSGKVHGGQQVISGATMQLYAAGSGGYGSAATPLISSTIQTDSNGAFRIDNSYTCPANAQVYLVATGGNPGLGTGVNNNLALMAALGPCSALTTSTFTIINEVTTVASVWPLARFMTGYANVGTSATNSAGLISAFAAVNKVANTTLGSAPGTLPPGATLPISEINTLANILGSCINSAGGVANDGSNCGTLFRAATPPTGPAPTDTIAAAVNIARNPASNLSTLFGLSSSNAPFQPSLATTPSNFLIGINYVGGGLNAPKGLAVDASGNIWAANSGNSSLTELNNVGTALSPATGFTGGGLNAPSAVAIDLTGNIWATNTAGNSVSKFLPAGTPFLTSPYSGGGLSAPSGISIDGSGNVWIANTGNNSVTELNSSGSPLSPGTGYIGAGLSGPTAIAVNPH